MSGKLFVIEGLDGSGKQTQSNMIYERLKSENRNVIKVSYPRYDNESSALVKMYLRGDFVEKPEDLNAYASSIFFAVDRYASFKQDYEGFYKGGGVVIADRYTTSNMVHQASKIRDKTEREKFLDWLWELEFVIFGIPEPSQVFFLDTPPVISHKLIETRNNKITNEREKDIHEKSEENQFFSYQTAQELAEKYSWEKIKCFQNDKILPIEEIHASIYKAFLKYL